LRGGIRALAKSSFGGAPGLAKRSKKANATLRDQQQIAATKV